MENRNPAVHELEALVEANREAFERARRLLAAMKQPRQHDPNPKAGQNESDAEDGFRMSKGETIPNVSGSSILSQWLDLPQLVRVELGPKEVPSDLIQSALSSSANRIWRAVEPGAQTIRLSFAIPQCIRRIRLVFEEHETERTQEFVLRWLQQGAAEYREIIRQQYVFSPEGSNRESEIYEVELKNLMAIELYLIPDQGDKKAFASLTQWNLSEDPNSAGSSSHLSTDAQGIR